MFNIGWSWIFDKVLLNEFCFVQVLVVEVENSVFIVIPFSKYFLERFDKIVEFRIFLFFFLLFDVEVFNVFSNDFLLS